jgi:hypothetical protein
MNRATQKPIKTKQAIPSQSRRYEKVITHSVLLVSSFINPSVSPEIIRGLDAKVRFDLQRFSDGFFFWVIVSAGIVVVGCALEGPEIFHELFPKLFSFITWPSNDRLKQFEHWTKKVGMIGWVLVVLGIAAEGIFEVYDHRASGFLQTFDEVLLTTAQRDTAEAYARAGDAEIRTAQLGIELAQQERRAAEAEKALALVNEKFGGWKLNPKAQAGFAAKLKPFSGTRFDLAVNPSEAMFMESLDSLLVSLGWIEEPPKLNGISVALLIDGKASIILSSGIVLEVDQDQISSLKPALNALGEILLILAS